MGNFQGFRPETGTFFWELCFNNDREWFYAHKEQFDTLINRPLKALAKDTGAIMAERYPDMDFSVHVSRIWRDARRLFGRGPLKESMWFTIKESRTGENAVSFYFELAPATFSWGMGFWCETAAQSEAFRKRVDANPAAFRRIAEEVGALEGFVLDGPEYSKPKGDYGEQINKWYNRKSVYVAKTEDFGGIALSPELPSVLADDFTALMPAFRFLSV